MNERIREVAIEAGLSYVPSSNNGPLRIEHLTPELEKFAELIVRECAVFVSNDRQNDDYGVFVANRIKEHFGVEE